MDITTCIKYFEFLNNECERLLKTDDLTKDYLENLNIEVINFKMKATESQLPSELITRIKEIDFQFSYKTAKKGNWTLILKIITIGGYGLAEQKMQEAHFKSQLNNLKAQVSGAPMWIKMKFS